MMRTLMTNRARKFFSAIFLLLLMNLLLPTAARADVYGWWPLDEGEGEVARDLGPRGVDGEIFNFDFGGLGEDDSVWFDDPERGTVISFNGQSDGAYVFAGEIPIMELETDFTWAFWARQDEDQATPANDVIIGNRHAIDGGDTVPREFIKFTPNRFEYHMNAGVLFENGQFLDDLQYSDCECEDDNIPSDPSVWLHHAVVKDGPMLTYYRNGEEWNSKEIETPQFSEDPLPFFMGGENTNSAGENWRGFLSDVRLFDHALSASEVMALVSPSEPGDFNGDGVLDAADIDALTNAVLTGTNPPEFDLNGDSVVDDQDRTVWVEDLRKTWFGDSNLDGIFNTADFIQVFQKGEYEDTLVGNSTWSTGDWNGDREFNSTDLIKAFQADGFEKGPRGAVSAVPEPSGLVALLLGACVGCQTVRRRRTR